MSKKQIKIAVTGAAGAIGYSLLFRIASGEMFGGDTDIYLNLLEIEGSLSKLRGVVMELEDCAYPLLKSINPTSDPCVAFKDIDWALLIGSMPRKAGMERKELLKINGSIFTIQGEALSDNAKPTCKIFVVGNPCNTNALLAKAAAPNIEDKKFFALTMLDQNRAAAQLALKAEVDVSMVKNIAIWGNHSSTQYPDFYNCVIDGVPALDVIKDEDWLKGEFIETVQKRGAAIIGARGMSSAASAATAVIDTIKNLITPTKDGEFFSVAVSSDGSYGVEEGLIFSYPVRSNGEDWEIVQDINLTSFAKERIAATLKELIEERNMSRRD